MGEAMADPEEHVHSRSAYEMMDDFQIGVLGGSEKVVSEGEFEAGFCGCLRLMCGGKADAFGSLP
jgi:hypothetical protein